MKKNSIIALGTLAAMSMATLSGPVVQPVEAKGFIRRHPILSAVAAGGAYLAYHHHHKKAERRRAYRRAR